MSAPRLRVDDFEYELPAGAIAQTPAEPRDASRLLVLERASGALTHARFVDIGRWLTPEDLLVVNDSRVIPARLRGTRPGGGVAELLVLRPLDDGSGRWEALARPSRRLADGAVISLRSGDRVTVGERLGDGSRAVRFDGDPHAIMARAGEMPLPPYIHDRSAPDERYQTVYARPPGSAAAPTARLHFTPDRSATCATDHPSAFAAGIGLFEITDPGRHCTQRQSGNWGSTAAYRDVDVVVLLAVGPQGLVRSGHGGASWEPLTKPGCAADSVRVGPCTPAGQLPGGQRRRTTTSKLGRERWRLRCW